MEIVKSLGFIDASIQECQRIIGRERKRLERAHEYVEMTGEAATLIFGLQEILTLLDHTQRQIWESDTDTVC